MNDAQKRKLEEFKNKPKDKTIKLVTNEDLDKLNSEHKSDFETFSKSVIKSIEDLAEALNVNVEISDLSPLNEKLEKLADLPDSFVTIKELSAKIHTELTKDKEVSIKGFRDLWEMLVRQNNQLDKNTDKKLTEVVEKFTDLRVYLDQLTETLKQGQDPDDFKPVRLVVGGDGVPLTFLKNMPSSRGGGGGSSGGSGDASAAKQDEQTALLTTIDADTGAIKTAVETLDNAISGSEMQVDVLTLPEATVVGNVASGVADSGNPVKAGAKYLTSGSTPTFTDGQRADLQVGSRGALRVQIMGADSTSSIAMPTVGADAETNTTNGLRVYNRNQVYNGSTWDRMRGDTNGTLVEQRFLYSRKTADGQVKASAGFVHTVTISPTTATPTAGLLTIYDNTAESGTIIFSEWVAATTPAHTVILNVTAGTGIYVGYDATLANVSCTVSYR